MSMAVPVPRNNAQRALTIQEMTNDNKIIPSDLQE